jgi:hypothetical protein
MGPGRIASTSQQWFHTAIGFPLRTKSRSPQEAVLAREVWRDGKGYRGLRGRKGTDRAGKVCAVGVCLCQTYTLQTRVFTSKGRKLSSTPFDALASRFGLSSSMFVWLTNFTANPNSIRVRVTILPAS